MAITASAQTNSDISRDFDSATSAQYPHNWNGVEHCEPLHCWATRAFAVAVDFRRFCHNCRG